MGFYSEYHKHTRKEEQSRVFRECCSHRAKTDTQADTLAGLRLALWLQTAASAGMARFHFLTALPALRVLPGVPGVAAVPGLPDSPDLSFARVVVAPCVSHRVLVCVDRKPPRCHTNDKVGTCTDDAALPPDFAFDGVPEPRGRTALRLPGGSSSLLALRFEEPFPASLSEAGPPWSVLPAAAAAREAGRGAAAIVRLAARRGGT